MVILHVAKISNILWSGVANVVPKHVNEQGKYETVGLVNLNNEEIQTCNNQISISGKFSLNSLEAPFNKPSLVVFHEVYHYEYIHMYKNLIRNNIPYIIVPHSSLTIQAKKRKRLKKAIADIIMFNQFVNSASAIQCLSNQEMQESVSIKKAFVSTNGIDFPTTCKNEFSEDGKRLIYVGRLESYQKGLDLMLDSVDKLRDVFSEAKTKLDIFGPDINDEGKRIREDVVKKRLDKIITIHDEIYDDKKRKELISSDVFVQTSRFEGMPMGILEALSYGLPCLVTRGTTMGDFVEQYDAGWVADNNIESIKKELERAICSSSQQLLAKSQNARKLIMDNYCWDSIAQNAINHYKEII